jgi:regulator of sirC expression with transglutaminase-like and TPR domain
MTKFTEFASLIRLLDDESESVRTAVGRRLLDYEDQLPEFISQLDPLPSTETFALLNRLIREAKCETLTDHWDDILTESDPVQRLELALGVIADYIDGLRLRSMRLTKALDELATEFDGTRTALGLVEKLFRSGRFTGNRTDYYDPKNSSLLAIIEDGSGNPISLACLLILVGKRLDLEIRGCNYPGHFLSLIPRDDGAILVDCFNSGQVVVPEDLIDAQVAEATNIGDSLFQAASTEVILLRVLRNLERAFHLLKQEQDRAVFEDLIERMLVSGMV